MRNRRRLWLAVFAVAVLCRPLRAEEKPALTIAAAADLSYAFKDVAEAFEKDAGVRVKFIFGSTGLLTKQIEEGAPFDLLAAANVSFADQAVKSGACIAETKALYGRGRISVWMSPGADLIPPSSLKDLAALRFRRIAIASPEHAPYGKAAKEALESAGIWKDVEKRIVYGENVKQTLQFAATGNADAAIVALSLAVMTPGPQVLVDESLHRPIDQALVVCRNGSNEAAARKFAAFVNSGTGRAIMKRFGFALPGEIP